MLTKIWNTIKSILKPISNVISNLVNFILLLIIYFTAIGIVSIVSKLFGKHFLELKKSNIKSNWYEHKVTKQPIEKYYRTF